MKKVSVIIPVYNGEATIKKTVDSALSQNYSNIEIIVIDDNSTDGTWSLLNKCYSGDVVLIKHPVNQGGSAARNSGINIATGEFIAFLDADDEWYPNKILQQVNKIEHSNISDCVAVYCKANSDTEAIVGGNHTGKFIREVFCGEANIVSASALLIKSSVLKKIEGFDPTFMRHQDIELIVRVMQVGSIDMVDAPLFRKIFSGDASMRSVMQGISCFWSKFEFEISNLNKRDRRMVFARGYLRFFEVAYKENHYSKSIYYFLWSLLCTPRAFWKKKGEYSASLTKHLSG
jgi:glycosyltransferase involved in cell wall biosynthesis